MAKQKKQKQFEPMLAPSNKKPLDFNKLPYPMLMSPKIDGVRAVIKDGELLSRSLKPIPNAYVTKLFAGLPEGTDGELALGMATAPGLCRRTVSAVMSEDGEPKDIRWHVFDNFAQPFGFYKRHQWVKEHLYGVVKVVIVPHFVVNSPEEVEALEAQFLEEGYEGGILRSMDGEYKFGRCTQNEMNMLKVKRFLDAEATVVGTYEYMHNDNEATKSATGHTERSSHKENLRPGNMLGGLYAVGLTAYEGVDFKIGTGFEIPEREELWKIRKKLVGRVAKFKYFPSGGKDKPRHPVFLSWRDERDM